jgi:hypothetical protein
MKKCKGCQTEIDPKATKCSHCGRYQSSWIRRHFILTYFLAGIIIFAFLGILGSNTHPTNSATSQVKDKTSAASTVTNTPEPTEAPKETPQPTAIPTPTKPLTLEERIKAKLSLDGDTKVTEISTETDADPITDKEIPGKTAVLISYHMNGTYLDTNWTKKASWNIDTGIIKDIFPLDSSINTIVMSAEVPVTTAYGKDTFDTLDTATIRRDTYTQINFAKFDSQNLPSIADHYIENHNIKD